MVQESTVITYLEMRSPQQLKPKYSANSRFRIERVTIPQWQFNRFLYSFIGEPWSWTDKNPWSDDQWRAYVESPNLQTFVACHEGSIAGYFEIQREPDNSVQIAYFGLASTFIGRGFGGPLLTRAVEEAWKWNVSRVWVHTCSLDHPAALNNYLARGFTIFKTETKLQIV